MTRLSSTLLLTGLLACGDDGTEPQTSTVPTVPDEEPSPYIYEEGEPPIPSAELADITEALQIALDTVLTVNADPVRESYEAAMAGSSYQCPYEYVTPDGAYWYDSCTSDTGTNFDGYVFSYGIEGIFDPVYGVFIDYWYAFGGAAVQDASRTLEIGGTAFQQKYYGDYGGFEIASYYSQVQGTFAWDGTEADGTWLDSEIDPDILFSTTAFPALNASSVFLDGGFGGLPGDWAVAFDENVIGSVELGLPCADEVSGTIGVRAPDGTWYDITFDGAADAYEPFDAAACDGCGVAYFRGEEVGQVCVDATQLMAMGVAPW